MFAVKPERIHRTAGKSLILIRNAFVYVQIELQLIEKFHTSQVQV